MFEDKKPGSLEHDIRGSDKMGTQPGLGVVASYSDIHRSE